MGLEKTFDKKIAIVTGAASGIGRAVSKELAKNGAHVICADIDVKGAKVVAAAIVKNNGVAEAVGLDVTNEKAVAGLIERVAKEHGRLDYIFNNAGIGIGGEVRDTTLYHWRKVVDVNLWGVIYGTHAAYSLMVEQGFGHIVNTASLAGLIQTPINTSYCMTKFAVVGLSTSLRTEGKDLGVKVSAICPGVIETNIFHKSEILKADRDEAMANVKLKIMDVDKAARLILKGVKKNKSLIVITTHAHVLWWMQRLIPSIVEILCLKPVRDFRKIRKDD